MLKRVPFADLYAQYLTIRAEVDAAIAGVIAESAFIRGPHVDAFERAFGGAIGVPHCVSCANGTDAIYIALRALGVGPGDEVIAPAHSWIATTETISQAGARPVFADTDDETFTLDPAQLEARITSRTRGIIPVHLFGQPADLAPIMEISRRHGLWVLEDCAQAHLAQYDGRTVGTFGVVGSFSFYPGKNLGAMGDAGALVTSDEALSRRMTMFARHGGLMKGDHEIEGINSRLDGLQAAILNVKLPHLVRWTAERQRIAGLYDRLLQGVGDVRVPTVAIGRTHVYHIYAIRTGQRDRLRDHLRSQGIATTINYPVALPFLPAYSYLEHNPQDFPVAFANQSRMLSLPMFAEITDDMVEYVCDQIRNFFARHA